MIELLLTELDSSKFFYFNNPDIDGILYSIVDGKVDYTCNKLESLKQYPMVVADFSTEHWGASSSMIDTARELLTNAGINFIILTHNTEDHQRHPEVFFYPHWYHWSRKFFVYPEELQDEKKKYLVGCFNGSARPHRIINYLDMLKKPYIDKSFFTFFNVPDHEQPITNEGITLTHEEQTEWDSIRKHLPYRNGPEGLRGQGRNIDHPICTDSYIHFVTESNVSNKVFITEKTWKPIASGQLFLLLGNPGSIESLRSWGVDCFDDIIDHKYYDHELDWSVRMHKIQGIIDSLVQQDLVKIYRDTESRRKANQKNYAEGVFDKNYSSFIRSFICTNMPN